MSNQELLMVKGGGFLTSTYLNSLARVMNSIMEAGRSFGTSLRMMFSGRTC